MIVNAQIELCRIHANMQELPFAEYKKLKSKADKVEKSVILNIEKNIARKVDVFKSRNDTNHTEETPSLTLCSTKTRNKHRRTQREVRRAYNKRRLSRKKGRKETADCGRNQEDKRK